MTNNNSKVALIMGSNSDKPIMKECERHLSYFGIDYELFVFSAHRMPYETSQFAKNAVDSGFKVIIAAAGRAAHLAGVIASYTILPVIGVPLATSQLNGLDALLSTVQMPAGVPVATVAIGNAGAINAAVLAAEILALNNTTIREKLVEFKSKGCKIYSS